MNKTLIFGLLFLNFTILSKDWLDLLIKSVGKPSKWDFEQVSIIIDNTIKKDIERDEEQALKLEKLNNETEPGFWGNIHSGSYKAELQTIKTNLKYNNQIIKRLNKINSDEKEQQDFTSELNILYKNQTDLKKLKKSYKKSNTWLSNVKLASLISLEQSKIMAKRTKIKSSFFLFD